MGLLLVKEWLLGAIAVGTFTAGLFFMRFWRMTSDRLFLYFALAFFGEVVTRVWMALGAALPEEEPSIYLLRLLSYGLVVMGIVDKNRAPL